MKTKTTKKEKLKKKTKTRKNSSLITFHKIENLIFEVRGQKVMLDADLAALYGTTTSALNQAVRRNYDRFPEDFMFKLNPRELSKVITNCDNLSRLKFSSSLPHVFTEYGALMLASILNSEIAVNVSVEIVRTFIKLRMVLATNKEVIKKINVLETKVIRHDENFKVVFDSIRQLMLPANTNSKKRVGF